MCSPNPNNASKNTKYITTCDDQTPPMPARKKNLSQNVFIIPIHAREDAKRKTDNV
jgi:hypothetical protein